MRKKFFNGKRVMAIALALSLVVGEAGVAVAAPIDAEETVETVSANEAAEEVVAEEPAAAEEVVAEEATEEVTTEEATEEPIEAETAFDGSVSKVIGLDGYSNFTDSQTDANGNPIYYSKVNSSPSDGTEIAGTDKQQYYDAATGFYLVNGHYYYSMYNWGSSLYANNEVTPLPQSTASTENFIQINGKTYVINKWHYNDADVLIPYYYTNRPIVQIVTVADSETAQKYRESKAKRFDGKAVDYDNYVYPQYYDCDGRLFMDVTYLSNGNAGVVVYGYESSEISFTSEAAVLTWKALTTENVAVSGDYKIQIGYQVEENGEIVEGNTKSADNAYSFMTYPSYSSKKAYAPGADVTYRVRGLYYVTDKDGKISVLKTGEWSDPYALKIGQRAQMPAVTGLSAVVNGSTIDLAWNKIVQAEDYRVEIIESAVPVPVTAENWKEFYYYDGPAYEAFRAANSDSAYSTWSRGTDNAYTRVSYDQTKPYCYFAVCVDEAVKNSNYKVCVYADPDFSNTYAYTSATAPTVANVPAISGFELQYAAGSYQVKWNPVDAKVAIFVYDQATFPAYYTAALNDPAGYDADHGFYTLTEKLTSGNRALLDKVQYTTTSGTDGSYNLNSFDFEVGKTYYVIAQTYDSAFVGTERAAIATIDGVAFTKYADFGPATAAVAVSKDISAPFVSTAMAAEGITLTMQSAYNATGFEIYKKKVGTKKYKKIATTTDWQYTDTDVKEGTSYSYKVRAYYYNTKTKRSAYSSYTYTTATATAGKNIDLTVTKKSATSVALNWTKVAGATKYEIYRSNVVNSDPSVVSKKFDSAKTYARFLSTAKYELVKTITKASTVKYTDKKLTAGETYNYVVVAYFKEGKKTAYVSDFGYAYLGLDGVQNLTGKMSGSTAKISWKKNPNASKYEVKYTVYNPTGNQAKAATIASTKKTSYAIGNIPAGGYVTVQVRAYGKYEKSNGKTGYGYSAWSESFSVNKSAVGVATKVQAANATVDGKDAVKISWKAAKNAAYYRVYRSTRAAVYNADTKLYYLPYTAQSVAKESNDDEGNSEVYYAMYNDEDETITGTSVYDYAQLDAGVKYYYYVVAYDANDKVASVSDTERYSTAVSAPASVVYKMSNPTIKKAKVAKGKVTLTIGKVTGAKSYAVYRSLKKGSGYVKIGTTKKTTFTDKKAKKGKTYYYKVVATGTNALKADIAAESAVKKVKVK